MLSEINAFQSCTIIFDDNQSALELITNPAFNNRGKYVDIWYYI